MGHYGKSSKAARYGRTYNEGGEGFNPYRDDGMAGLVKADAARKAKYGSSSCPHCGKVYAARPDGWVEDHTCSPMSADKMAGM